MAKSIYVVLYNAATLKVVRQLWVHVRAQIIYTLEVQGKMYKYSNKLDRKSVV